MPNSNYAHIDLLVMKVREGNNPALWELFDYYQPIILNTIKKINKTYPMVEKDDLYSESAFILKDYAYFRADARYVAGRLVYYKKPSVMTIDDSSSVFYEADSFDRTLYDVIANHAAACLSARQEPTPRLMKNLQQSIKFLMEDPIDQVIPLPEGIA